EGHQADVPTEGATPHWLAHTAPHVRLAIGHGRGSTARRSKAPRTQEHHDDNEVRAPGTLGAPWRGRHLGARAATRPSESSRERWALMGTTNPTDDQGAAPRCR